MPNPSLKMHPKILNNRENNSRVEWASRQATRRIKDKAIEKTDEGNKESI